MAIRIQKSTAKVVLFFVVLALGIVAVVSWARMQRVEPSAVFAGDGERGGAKKSKLDGENESDDPQKLNPGRAKAGAAEIQPGPRWQPLRDLWVLRGSTMGTRYQISVRDAETSKLSVLSQAIEARLETINASMSTYREDSEIVEFNRAAVPHEQKVSPDFAKVLELSLEVARQSGGAFDPTVGPLVRAWGFGAGSDAQARSRERGPDKTDLAKLRANIGYTQLSWVPETRVLGKTRPLELDFSAVAKGYAVAEVSRLLSQRGYPHHMVEIGGEVQAQGRVEGERWWQIGIEKPSPSADSAPALQDVLALAQRGMATSGDYRNYIEKAGKRRSHTIDPRSGRPARHQAASVTVLAEDAGQADAWATALMVLGPQEGLDFAKERQIALMYVLREPEGFSTRESPAWTKYVEQHPPQKRGDSTTKE